MRSKPLSPIVPEIMPRRTLATPIELSGTGLHTGVVTSVRCLPAPSGTGIRFRRVDLEGRPEFPARVEEVEATERRTAIGHGQQTVHTVEHLLAAVAALELDDLLVEVNGPEAPILDGSFAPFLKALEASEIPVVCPLTDDQGQSIFAINEVMFTIFGCERQRV